MFKHRTSITCKQRQRWQCYQLSGNSAGNSRIYKHVQHAGGSVFFFCFSCFNSLILLNY